MGRSSRTNKTMPATTVSNSPGHRTPTATRTLLRTRHALILASAFLSLIAFAVPLPAQAQRLRPQAIPGLVAGVPQLHPNPKQGAVELFVVDRQHRVVVRSFDISASAWKKRAVVFRQTTAMYLGYGGPAYAVDGSGGLHVLWSDRGDCECKDLAKPGTAGTVLRHASYHRGKFNPVEVLERRATGDQVCFYHHPAIASDHAGRLVAGYFVGNKDTHAEFRGYRLFDGSSWAAKGRMLPSWKGRVGAAGFAGRLFLSYYTNEAGHAYLNLLEFAPQQSKPRPRVKFGVDDVAFSHMPGIPVLSFASDDDLHMVWPEACAPDWSDCRMFYNRRKSSKWAFGSGGRKLFGRGTLRPSRPDLRAEIGMAASPAGPVLVAFSFDKRLYLLWSDGKKWSTPKRVESVSAAYHPSVARLSHTKFLVAWADRAIPSGSIHWGTVTVCPAGQTECSDECVDLSSDEEHCGSCTNPCQAGEECVGGRCVEPDAGAPDASGTEAGGGEASAEDAGRETPAEDASLPDGNGLGMGGRDGGEDHGDDACAGDRSEREGGCDCRLVPGGSKPGGGTGKLLWLLLAAMAWRRHRRANSARRDG